MEIHYLEREISLFECKMKYLALIFLNARFILSFVYHNAVMQF